MGQIIQLLNDVCRKVAKTSAERSLFLLNFGKVWQSPLWLLAILLFLFCFKLRSIRIFLPAKNTLKLRSMMRLFLLLVFNALMLLETYRFSDETDSQALMKFKSQVSEDKKVALSSWNNSFPLCNWKGVTCGRKHRRITHLQIGGLHLGGVISPSIGNLSYLRLLDLSNNSFGGTIPQEVGNLFRLERFNLDSNFLEGRIPVSLSNCSRMLGISFIKNKLVGSVPPELGSWTNLGDINLAYNRLTGTLPASLGNLTSLTYLGFGINNMEGEIPGDIAKLSELWFLELSFNNFSGVFPPAIYNLSSVQYLSIENNRFSGSLRPDFGHVLPKLTTCNLASNSLTGAIPTTLSNISNLHNLQMDSNNFMGSISPSFGQLLYLQMLSLQGNSLGSYSSKDFKFLDALTNCTHLEYLAVGVNRLGGELPTSIVNMSMNLVTLGLSKNFIYGSIPHDIGNLFNLQELRFRDNMLTGHLPTSFGKLSNLVILSLYSNKMYGELPSFIGNFTQLIHLDLSNNKFEGSVPLNLTNSSTLLELGIGCNQLSGTIPLEIFKISSLTTLNISHNFLSGSLPEDVGQLKNLLRLDVSYNKLSEKLPRSLGNCLSVDEIYVQGNSLDGIIPDISGLVDLKHIDFSNNNLSGSIPGYFANFSLLEYLNLSINNFEGRVPTEGSFQNATKVFLFGNKNLCGGIKALKLKPCFMLAPPVEKKPHSLFKKVVIGVSTCIAFLLILFIAVVSLCWFRKWNKNQHTNNPTPSMLEAFHEMISYGDLQTATNGFSSSNLIGSGSFGIVFKALLPAEEKVVAVKVLNLKRHGAIKSFMAECESLKNIRHRNLVKLLTTCSSIDFQGNEFRALIYEFMPNESLDVWLHPEEVEEIHRPSKALSLFERLNIAIDVVSVLDYLHVYCHEPIAHCDLKASNILLDNDLTAHVSDFGLARFLFKQDQKSYFNQLSSANIRGTIGYAAPEYGMGGQPSIHGDMYSFWVLVLEMFTGKRPTNEIFEGNSTLHSYTKLALPEKVLDIAEKSILQNGLKVGFPVAECLTLVLEVGLRCCEESPMNRLATSDALKELTSIKERFFKARRTARH